MGATMAATRRHHDPVAAKTGKPETIARLPSRKASTWARSPSWNTIPFTGGRVATDAQTLLAHETHYKRLNGVIPSTLITTTTTSPFSGDNQAAAVVGFGGTDVKGIERFLIFVDNHASSVFGPLQQVLLQRIVDGVPFNFHHTIENVQFFEHAFVARLPELDEWYKDILETKNYIGALPDKFRNNPAASFYLGFVGACLVLASEHPELFVEREGTHDGGFVRGVSLEDLMRCSIVARHYVRRRKAGDYGTANKRSPGSQAGKVNLDDTIVFYKSNDDIAKEAANSEGMVMEGDYVTKVASVLQMLQNCGFKEEYNVVAQQEFDQLDGVERENYCYRHFDVLEKFRIVWYNTTKDNVIGKQLAHMDTATRESLMKTIENRIHNMHEGMDPLAEVASMEADDLRRWTMEQLSTGLESADLVEPMFEVDGGDPSLMSKEEEQSARYNPFKGGNDNNVPLVGVRRTRLDDTSDVYTREEVLKSDYNALWDGFSGGNDTCQMTVERAEQITGISYEHPYIDPSKTTQGAKLHPHQIVDTAALLEKLIAYPHAGLLANACGTGKTATYLATITQINRRQLTNWQNQQVDGTPPEQQQKFHVSIVFVPATLIKPTFDECRNLFPKLLSPHIYYGTKHDYMGNIAASTAFIEPDGLSAFVNKHSPDDPETGKVVIITSYVTFKRRETTGIQKLRDQLTYDDRVFLGHHMTDSPASLDRRSNAQIDLQAEGDELDRQLLDNDDEFDEDDDNEVESRRLNAENLLEDTGDTPESQMRDEVDEVNSALRAVRRRRKSEEKKKEQVYTLYSAKNPIQYNVVVCDEAHLLKNHKSAIHKAVKCLRRESLLLVTATPMLNTVMDILSLLLLAIPRSPASYTPPSYSYHTMYGDGGKLGLCQPLEDPRLAGFLERDGQEDLGRILRIAADSGAYNGPIAGHPILGPYFSLPGIRDGDPVPATPIINPQDPEYDAKLTSWETYNRKWWQLLPCNVRWAAKEFGSDFEGARVLIRPIFEQLCVKRGMQTMLKLPDGRIVRPGDQLKGAAFRVVNVQFPPEEQLGYNAIWNEWGRKLYTADDEEDTNRDKSRGKDLPDRPRGSGSGNGGRINAKAVRHLTIPAFNLQNKSLLAPRVKTAGLAKSAKRFAPSGYTHQKDQAQLLSSLQKTDTKDSRKRAAPAMGVEEVSALINDHPKDGGASWVYEVLKAGPEYPPLSSRYQYLYFHTYRSPILCATIMQVNRWLTQPIGSDGLPNRVVIMANMPWIQQEVALCLEMMGWNVLSIRSDHSVQERNVAIDKFNDPDSDVQILLTSMDLSAYGLNLHKSCCKGIVIQWPWNANHLIQILGRLPRIGQWRFVEWVIFHIPGTIYDKMQTIVWSKYVRQLAVESKISSKVIGVWATIAAHGYIYKLFNLPYNRWLWDRTAFNLDVVGIDTGGRGGYTNRNVTLSLFFERVAELLNDSRRTPPSPDKDLAESIAFNEISDRTRNDLVAGAYRWFQQNEERGEAQASGREVPITYVWLAEHCTYSDLDQENKREITKYISNRIIKQLNSDLKFAEIPTRARRLTKLRGIVEGGDKDENEDNLAFGDPNVGAFARVADKFARELACSDEDAVPTRRRGGKRGGTGDHNRHRVKR
ncbi:hypothetical protein GQX73_g4328 [Xylaria multiplex]|uniref:Helicase ATP-binding domain-containing protein n=1 Tax=Xylaria multiplex TaxID=323545 RepID=A0A7C8IPU2_9PEZI|nr:hypothetical protein GQX73_g4328 [Xylaria multiplex]